MNSFFFYITYSWEKFFYISDKYSNKEFWLALRVDSVNPPELVINPFNIDTEYTSESKKGLIELKTNYAFLHGK